VRNPDAPPTAPPLELRAGPYIAGASAEQVQQATALTNRALSMVPAGVANTGLRGRPTTQTSIDSAPAQVFPTFEPIAGASAPNVGLDLGGAFLPGRRVPTAWDGEPGADDPVSGSF
jgi:hypothetical protein